MIFFLLICYVGLLALLVRLRIVQLTLFWKLSPVLFAAVCLVVLIIPLQWGAPSGAANVYRGVVEIIPNITGEVSEVVAKPLEPMKRGEVLFKIDSKLVELCHPVSAGAVCFFYCVDSRFQSSQILKAHRIVGRDSTLDISAVASCRLRVGT